MIFVNFKVALKFLTLDFLVNIKGNMWGTLVQGGFASYNTKKGKLEKLRKSFTNIRSSTT